MRLTLATAAVGLVLACGDSARADGYHLRPTLPREVLAYDYSTGGVMMAPPIPYGHYAKDNDLLGCVGCRMHKLMGCLGCGHDGLGHGLAHSGGCGLCGGKGCGSCLGQGGGDPGCGGAGCGGHGLGHHLHHKKAGKFAPCDSCVGPVVAATGQSMPAATAVVQPSGQSPCGVGGCGLKGLHSHKGGHWRRCGLCGGKGCGGCGGGGLMAGCGDPGCGSCGGKAKGCHFCGGKGCGHCLSGGLSGLHGKLAGLLHPQKIEYFVGPGGPVPLTPGYVPYIVPTRSPRDFFSFPPMNPYAP